MLALHSNWIDLVIIIVLLFFIHQGFVTGFWAILIDFISFFGSLLISLRTYKIISSLLQRSFRLNFQIGNALGFLISAIILEILLSFIFGFLISKLPRKILNNSLTKILGIILSFGQGLILIAFLLTFALSLPINPEIKISISNSKIGSLTLRETSGIEKAVNDIFGGAINESLTYLTVEPKSHESILLENITNNLTIDKENEKEMFDLINKERKNQGSELLIVDTKLQKLARDYATFMWKNHYFGHYDNFGHDIGYRLDQSKIPYEIAGENLALAPSVLIAHTGLMNSPGHRANILDARFHKVGVGVIDNGFYGKMFVQEFTN